MLSSTPTANHHRIHLLATVQVTHAIEYSSGTASEAAFTLLAAGKGPKRPDKLAGWLIEIARRRGLEYHRKDKPAGVSWAILPEGQSLD